MSKSFSEKAAVPFSPFINFVAAMVITVIFARDRVHVLGNSTEIVSMAKFGVPPVHKAIVVQDDAPDIQIIVFPTPLSVVPIDGNFTLTNSLGRVQNIGVWSDNVVSRDFSYINWKRFLWKVIVIAQLPI